MFVVTSITSGMELRVKMFNLIDKWMSLFPDKKKEETIQLINAPRTGLSRRGFIGGVVAGVIGITTGIIEPPRTILVPGIELPGSFDTPYPMSMNDALARAYLRPLSTPLYDTEVFDFKDIPTSLTFFQSPIA